MDCLHEDNWETHSLEAAFNWVAYHLEEVAAHAAWAGFCEGKAGAARQKTLGSHLAELLACNQPMASHAAIPLVFRYGEVTHLADAFAALVGQLGAAAVAPALVALDARLSRVSREAQARLADGFAIRRIHQPPRRACSGRGGTKPFMTRYTFLAVP